jgi:tetratricopeptide (TPR) repeat protein
MATKRKVVKKNIKRDPLVTYALKVSRYSQEHFNQVVIGVAVLIVLIAVVVFTANNRQNAARQSVRQMAQAMALYQQRDYEAAKVSFTQVADRFGGSTGSIARYYVGECDLGLGRYAEALNEYQAYLDKSSKQAEFKVAALVGMALCHEGMGNYTAAAETMEKVHNSVDEKDPRYLDSAYRAGELFAKAGNDERAAHYFQIVADNATGTLKDKASVAVTLLNL